MWGVLLLGITSFAWFVTRQNKLLLATLAIASLMILLVYVEHQLITDKEYLWNAVYLMAECVEENDAEGVIRFVRPDNEVFKDRIRRNMKQYEFKACTVIGFSKTELAPNENSPQTADIGFAVWATGTIAGRPETFQHVNVAVRLEFKKSNGNWYIEAYGYRPSNSPGEIKLNRN